MTNLETLARLVANGGGVSVGFAESTGIIYASSEVANIGWHGPIAEWQTALRSALDAQPHYPQLTDWVRAQPEGSCLLAVFSKDEPIPSVFVGDNHGKRLDDCYEVTLAGRMSSGGNYSAVWLSRHVDPNCEAKIPRGVNVYRERA